MKKRRRNTLAAVAEKSGVAKSTASRILSGRGGASDNARKRVLSAAKSLGYKRDDILSRVMSGIRGSGAMPQFETVAFVNAKNVRDCSKSYSAIARYVAAAKDAARKSGYSVCDIWLYEKNFTPQKLERLMRARNMRGGIIYGHYYKDSIPKDFFGVLKKFKFVSMGVRANAPVEISVFMDRFLVVKGYAERIMKSGCKRVGFVIEKFADKYENGKFSGGFLSAQLERNSLPIMPPLFWSADAEKNGRALEQYVARYSPDAIFSYSTDISDILTSKNFAFPSSVKLFHYDEKYRNAKIGRISNQKDVGEASMRTLSEILGATAAQRRKINILEISVSPKWTAARK